MQDPRICDPEKRRKSFGKYCAGCICRNSHDGDDKEGKEKFYCVYRQVAGIRFSQVFVVISISISTTGIRSKRERFLSMELRDSGPLQRND